METRGKQECHDSMHGNASKSHEIGLRCARLTQVKVRKRRASNRPKENL